MHAQMLVTKIAYMCLKHINNFLKLETFTFIFKLNV